MKKFKTTLRRRLQGRKDARLFRQRHPERHKQLLKESYARHRLTRLKRLAKRYKEEREWLTKLKDKPCLDCGVKYPTCVMEFDHVKGVKKAGVGQLLGHERSREAILTEIAKCELVCANCHRIRTAKRKQFGGNRKYTEEGLFMTSASTVPGGKDEE